MRRLLLVASVVALAPAGAPASEAISPLGPPLPPPVPVRETPEVALADPAFEPLPGARAEYGRLGGTAFQIELPKRWNGRLVLWMHGSEEFRPEAKATPPDFRRHLIARGFAWAASSFSSTAFIPGRAADETAALWDHFARTYGRPERAYVIGESMGGWATHIAAERYSNRFDGALGLCGAVGTAPGLSISTDLLVAAAYVAGVTQAAFDAAPGVQSLIDRRIRPALRDPSKHAQFERIVVALTGGPRTHDRFGIHLEEETNLRRASLLVATRLAPRREGRYVLAAGSPVTSAAFDRAAIRFPIDAAAQRVVWAGLKVTGRLRMPLLTLHTTGDGQVPIDQALILRERVAKAGKRDLLVQRVIRDANHCGFRTAEQEAAFDALVDWVEKGQRPPGTNLDNRDLRRLDRTFELGPPRAGSDRVTVSGRATLDGRPFDARWIGAVVRTGPLVTPCQATLPPITQGRYRIAILGARTALGCGRPGTEILLWTYAGERKLFATRPVSWPRTRAARADVAFSTADPLGAAPVTTEFSGEIYGSDGSRIPYGTRVEAWVGNTLCGLASVGSSGYYILSVVGPDSLPGCTAGATVTFRVEGRQAVETGTNSPEESKRLNLTLPTKRGEP